MRAPTPENEPERLSALDRYDILDTPREVEFDEIIELIAHICQAPVAIVSLIAEDRQWFKAEVGFGVRETPLESSFCAHALLEPGLMVVPDTTEDERFTCNPLVTGEMHFRFYAGALLETPDGFPIGTLCVLDTEPRDLDDHQRAALSTLARHVMNLLDLRRTTNAQASLAAHLEQSVAQFRRLHAMVSHDLRTPLGSVSLAANYIELVADQVELREAAARILTATEAMTHLIDDLDDAQSTELTEFSVDFDRCRVPDLLKSTLDVLGPVAERADIALELRIDQGLPELRCDIKRTAQILTNIIGNAIKFSSSGTSVEVRAVEDDEHVRFEVSDCGPGIAEEELPDVFRAFWRSPSAREDGTGVGLAIARRLVELQDGTIGVDSELGQGTTFWFTLPAVDVPTKAMATRSNLTPISRLSRRF
jgi:signal transduction histidine kinase